jgi:hypothetical protein
MTGACGGLSIGAAAADAVALLGAAEAGPCPAFAIALHPDAVGAFLLAEAEQLGNAPSRRFCLFPSPQLNIELEHGSEIVVEREPVPRRKTFPLQLYQVGDHFSQLSV